MRSVALAIYLDVVDAEAAAIEARIDRARGRLLQAAIEHQARAALPAEVVARLEAVGLLGRGEGSVAREEVERGCADRDAVVALQSWLEQQVAAEPDDDTTLCSAPAPAA
jgi:hypothetical protein